jgi:hypothetical protein
MGRTVSRHPFNHTRGSAPPATFEDRRGNIFGSRAQRKADEAEVKERLISAKERQELRQFWVTPTLTLAALANVTYASGKNLHQFVPPWLYCTSSHSVTSLARILCLQSVSNKNRCTKLCFFMVVHSEKQKTEWKNKTVLTLDDGHNGQKM